MADFSALPSLDGDSVIFTCGLLLPQNQAAAAIALCNSIAENNPHKLKFILNAVTHPPYVRLYETVIPKKNIQTAVTRLEKILAPMIPFHMTWGMIEQTDHFVAIWGELNQTLKVFQQAIVLGINELREGDFKEKYIEDENDHAFSAEEDKSFKKWGSPWAEPYIPHMIIAKAAPVFEVKASHLEWEFTQCLFPGVLIGVRSDKGDFVHSFQVNFSSANQSANEPPDLTQSDILSLM